MVWLSVDVGPFDPCSRVATPSSWSQYSPEELLACFRRASTGPSQTVQSLSEVHWGVATFIIVPLQVASIEHYLC